MRSQKGFTAVEALLILVILGIIGGTGWYVWHSSKTADQTYSNTNNRSIVPQKKTANSTKVSDSNIGYFVIKEWGVRAKYSGTLHLTYTMNTSGVLQSAAFSSFELNDSNSICKEGGDYGGRVNRYKSTDQYLVGDDGIDSGKTAAQYASALSSGTYGHVGDYYYFHIGVQAACGESKTTQDLQSQTIAAVQLLVKNLEVTPAQ